MHPQLLNNSHFLRYSKQWQDDPGSIAFVPMAEYFLLYNMVDEALAVCRRGLERHPRLVSGHLALAKVHMKRGNWEEAEEAVRAALSIMPENGSAQGLLAEIAERRRGEASPASAPRDGQHSREAENDGMSSWKTVTMATIYASQGHHDEARRIFRSILERDPNNEPAQRGLASLP